MCEVTKMPATSLFAKTMAYIANIIPALQAELSSAEEILASMAKKGKKMDEGVGDISKWLDDNSAECFFEISIEPCESMKVYKKVLNILKAKFETQKCRVWKLLQAKYTLALLL